MAKKIKIRFSTCVILVSAAVIVPLSIFTLLKSFAQPVAIASAPNENSLIDEAIATEGRRIVSFAATDPRCGETIFPGDPASQKVCFLNRLKEENRAAIARELFRQKALESASGN